MQYDIAGFELMNLNSQGEHAKLWAIGTVNNILWWTQQDIWVSVIVTAQQQTHTPHKLKTTWSSLKRLRDGRLKVLSPRLCFKHCVCCWAVTIALTQMSCCVHLNILLTVPIAQSLARSPWEYKFMSSNPAMSKCINQYKWNNFQKWNWQKLIKLL